MILRFIKDNLAEILLPLVGIYLVHIGVTIPQMIIVLVVTSLANLYAFYQGKGYGK